MSRRSLLIVKILIGLILLSGLTLKYIQIYKQDDPFRRKPSDGVQSFEQLVKQYFKEKRGLSVKIKDGYLYVLGDKNNKYARMGLFNLAQRCAQTDPKLWERMIEDHFDNMLDSIDIIKNFADSKKELDKVSKYITVCLHPQEYLDSIKNPPESMMQKVKSTDPKDHVIYREDIPGILTIFSYDLPVQIINIPPDDMNAWQKTPDDLFLIALGNLRRKDQPDMTKEKLDGGGEMILFTGDDLQAASHAFLLQEHQGCEGKYGTFVGIPTRNNLLCLPINNSSATRSLNSFVKQLNALFDAGPSKISGNLYWYHEKSFTHLPYTIKGREIKYQENAQLGAIINQMLKDEKKP